MLLTLEVDKNETFIDPLDAQLFIVAAGIEYVAVVQAPEHCPPPQTFPRLPLSLIIDTYSVELSISPLIYTVKIPFAVAPKGVDDTVPVKFPGVEYELRIDEL
jgi:hypothetical protein